MPAHRKYFTEEERREAILSSNRKASARYKLTEKGIATQKRYDTSYKRLEQQNRRNQSPKGREARKRYEQSPKGLERQRRQTKWARLNQMQNGSQKPMNTSDNVETKSVF